MCIAKTQSCRLYVVLPEFCQQVARLLILRSAHQCCQISCANEVCF